MKCQITDVSELMYSLDKKL